jgi:hypothetical protein
LAGTPLKPEYTQENLPLVEAGFCNLRKQVIIAKIIKECAGKIVFVLRGLRGVVILCRGSVHSHTATTTRVADPGCLPRIPIFFHPGSNNKKRRGKQITVVVAMSFAKLDYLIFLKQVQKLRPEIRKKLVPDPGVKKAPDPGSGSATLTPTYPPYPPVTVS